MSSTIILKNFIYLGPTLLLAACSSETITTKKYSAEAHANVESGISVAYSLPKGLLKVTVSQETGKLAKISFGETILVPDSDAKYLAVFNRKAFGV